MKDFCILGSGVSGSTIARLLSKKYTIQLFEKAKGVGGRASNRRFKKDLSFDHGTQYISPKNNSFKNFVSLLIKKKILKAWKGQHINHELKQNKNANKYIGKKGNSDISKYLLKKIDVRLSKKIKNIKFNSKFWTITSEDNSKINFRYLILTCPYPQVKLLARNYIDKKMLNLKVKMEPNLTVMAVYKGYKNNSISSFKFNDDILGWAANENSKLRFKSKYLLWTIQSNNKWAKKYINKYKQNKKDVTFKLINRFSELTGFNNQNIIFSTIHGWKYSFNYKKTTLKSYWSTKYNIGVCGDWFLGPKIEHAWLSANDLFKKIKKNPLKK